MSKGCETRPLAAVTSAASEGGLCARASPIHCPRSASSRVSCLVSEFHLVSAQCGEVTKTGTCADAGITCQVLRHRCHEVILRVV